MLRAQHHLVDHQAGRPAEGLGELLVLFAERLAVEGVGEVEVAEDVSVADRPARRGIVSSAGGSSGTRGRGVLGDVVEAQRRAVTDDLAQQSPPRAVRPIAARCSSSMP
jgi:hypothetical protein